jgi:hypothetical protein
MDNPNRRADDKRAPGQLHWSEAPTSTQVAEQANSSLFQQMAAAGAAVLNYMDVAGAISRIENTDPPRFVMAGTLSMIAGMAKEKATDKIAPASADNPSAASDELHIGVSNNDQGVHINIMQRHADGSATMIYSAKAPAGDSYGRASLATQSAKQGAQPSAWISVDERLPAVPTDDNQQFIVACRRGHNGKTYVFAAGYLNARDLHNDDEGAVSLTGWYTESEHPEYNGWFEPVCQAGDEVTHWMPLPSAPGAATQAAPEQAAQVQADVRDAERYRFLRDSCNTGFDVSENVQLVVLERRATELPKRWTAEPDAPFRVAIRAAIDDAVDEFMKSKRAASTDGEAKPSELQTVAKFLMGEAPLEGVNFGDKHPTKAGAFWWRLNLRAALHAANKG